MQIGIFLLDELAEPLGKENILYHNDRLAMINGSGPHTKCKNRF